MESVNITPMLATWKESKKTGLCPVHINVVINGKRFAFPSAKVKVRAADWDNDKKCIKPGVENASLLNGKIAMMRRNIEADLSKKQLLGQKLNKVSVKKQVRSKAGGQDFYKFCLEQIAIKNYSSESRRTYVSEVSKLQQFAPDLTFQDLDYAFLQKYEAYMRSTLGNAPNTLWKSLKFINTMCNLAMSIGGYIESNPVEDFDRGKYEQGIPEYLEWSEVQQLHKEVKTGPLPEDLKLIGYYSLLSCYSGLRFSDATRFAYDKFVIEDSRGKRLLLYAKKNGEIVSMPFTKEIAEVVEYIKDRPISITNQEFNRYLKVIGKSAKLKKVLKSHIFRHSFAMRCAELGMSEETVQHLLGHKDRKSTRIYFRIKNNRVDLEMEKWG